MFEYQTHLNFLTFKRIAVVTGNEGDLYTTDLNLFEMEEPREVPYNEAFKVQKDDLKNMETANQL